MNIETLEQKVFGSKSRFALNSSQKKELIKDLKNSNILIIGAAGSIGKIFSKKIIDYKFKSIVFFDKDENGLTDLSRDISLRKNKIKREFICSDLNVSNLKKIIQNYKITHLLNFAALKHVRSEENFETLNYLFKTNLASVFEDFRKYNVSHLKKIFFISTDKTAYPSSVMGCSKKIMENELYKLKLRFKNKSITTVRFANVAFSNGSILKNIYERTLNSEVFGIPLKIKRFFVTHKEAADLCLISLLKEADGNIIIPNPDIFQKQFFIKDIASKIVKVLGKKIIFSKKIINTKNNQQLALCSHLQITGQKNQEHFSEQNEKKTKFNGDNRVLKIRLYKNHNNSRLLKKLTEVKNIDEIKYLLSYTFKKYIAQNKKKIINLKDII